MRFDPREFGQRIKVLRKGQRLTQEQLADVLNITTDHLGKIELGKRGISIDLLFEMAEVLDVSLDFLVTGRRYVSAQTVQLVREMRVLLDKLEAVEDNPP